MGDFSSMTVLVDWRPVVAPPGGRRGQPTRNETRDARPRRTPPSPPSASGRLDQVLKVRCRHRQFLGRASVDRRFGASRVQPGELLGHDPLALFEVALRGSRAPAAPHGEDESEEDDHAPDAHPPPSLPLVRGGLLRGDDELLCPQKRFQVGRSTVAICAFVKTPCPPGSRRQRLESQQGRGLGSRRHEQQLVPSTWRRFGRSPWRSRALVTGLPSWMADARGLKLSSASASFSPPSEAGIAAAAASRLWVGRRPGGRPQAPRVPAHRWRGTARARSAVPTGESGRRRRSTERRAGRRRTPGARAGCCGGSSG